MALNCSDIPLPKMWLQGLSVCLSEQVGNVCVGEQFWCLGSPGPRQTSGGCSSSSGGREGAGQEEGSAWKKITFWLCPALPERRARGVAPVGTGTALPVGRGERRCAHRPTRLGCGQCCDEGTQPCPSWHTV